MADGGGLENRYGVKPIEGSNPSPSARAVAAMVSRLHRDDDGRHRPRGRGRDRAVAGDDQDVLVHERPAFASLADERDPVHQVQLIADLICDIQERSAPIQAAYREAAAVDVTVAASVEAAHRRRLETFGVVLGMLPEDRLRHTPQECTDTVWAVASTEVFLLLLNIRGWSWDQIRQWLARTLVDLLLAPQT